jgi:hypothetical protein
MAVVRGRHPILISCLDFFLVNQLDVLGTLRLMRLIIIVTHCRRFKFINFKLLVRNCRISALVLSALHVFEQRILLKNAL